MVTPFQKILRVLHLYSTTFTSRIFLLCHCYYQDPGIKQKSFPFWSVSLSFQSQPNGCFNITPFQLSTFWCHKTLTYNTILCRGQKEEVALKRSICVPTQPDNYRLVGKRGKKKSQDDSSMGHQTSPPFWGTCRGFLTMVTIFQQWHKLELLGLKSTLSKQESQTLGQTILLCYCPIPLSLPF